MVETRRGSADPQGMTATRQRAPKFRRRAEARPEEVLDAALDLFIEKGFAATRVEDIAKKAGLSKGAVYLYFPSKEAIMEALVRRAIVPVAENAAAFVAGFGGNPRDGIATLMQLVCTRLSDRRMLAVPRLMLHEAVLFPELAAMYRREVLERALPLVVELLRRGIESGVFRPADPVLTARNVVGPLLMHMLLAEVFGIGENDSEAVQRFVKNHLDVLFNGLSAPEGGK